MKPPNTLLAVLREDVLPGLLAQHPYISLAAVKAELKRQRRAAGPNTRKQYLSQLKREGVVHDAGKGWYTSVKEPFEVNPAPVAPLVSLLEAKYPLLDFACWSTEQVKSYVHLTLTRFASFVYVERHNRSAVFETLREAGWDAWLDPSPAEAGKTFTIREKTVVVRPSITQQPVAGKVAPIEKLLVDLYVECGLLPLMDLEECRRMATNLVRSRRVNVAALSDYTKRRNVRLQDLFETREYTILSF